MHLFSNQFKNEMENDHRNFLIKMEVETQGGQKFIINNSDIWRQTLNLDTSTSVSGAFTVGGLICSKLTFSINNADERFSFVDFIDAIITLHVGMELSDGTIEMRQYGVFNVSEASFTAAAINIVALDNLSKLHHPCEESFDAGTAAYAIVIRCCQACGITYDPEVMPVFLRTYRIATELSGDYSYASIISYAAQIAGCFVTADIYGRLHFGWYELSALKSALDGGTFAYDGKGEDGEPEAQLDGGSFDRGAPSYATGDDVDGGTFRSLDGYHIINNVIQSEIDTDDVRITGVRVAVKSETEDMPDDITMIGHEGYVIEVKDNPFVPYQGTLAIAQNIWDVIGNMIFRPLNATILPDPMIEAGDVGFVSDKNGNYYACFFSTVKFSPDGNTAIACDAQSANRQSRGVQSSAQLAITTAVQQSKKWVAIAKKDAFDFIKLMSEALGFFSTEEIQKDGSTIKYLHNAPSLKNSDIQWKITVDGIAVSTDYGQTWNAGISKEGNMMVQVLQAIGINADWINAGAINGLSINGGSVNGTYINGAYINGGSININDLFVVDGSGACSIDNLSVTQNLAVHGAGGGTTTISGGGLSARSSLGGITLAPTGLTLSSGYGSVSISANGITVNGNEVAMLKDVRSLATTVATNTSRIYALEQRLSSIESEIKDIEAKNANQTKRLDNQLERIKALEAKIK